MLYIIASFEVPESLLLREIVYIFQGIEGKFIKFENTKQGLKIDPKVSVLSVSHI